MTRLSCSICGLLSEHRLVDEEIGIRSYGNRGVRGSSITSIHNPSPRTGITDNLIWMDHCSVIEFDRPSFVELLEFWSNRDTEFFGPFAVETALSLCLDEGVPYGLRSMVCLERLNPVLIMVNSNLIGINFLNRNRVLWISFRSRKQLCDIFSSSYWGVDCEWCFSFD